MNKKKIAKLRRELAALRAGKYNVRPSDLVAFAKKLGRGLDTSRGKEPTYVSVLPGTRPLSIPGHPKINPHTADAILDHLETDLDKWESIVENEAQNQKGGDNENRRKLSPATIRKNSDSSRTE